MSGGVDSSVAALLLKEQGYDVVGLYMVNWEEEGENGCCTAEADYEDVKRVCNKIGIPYYTVNFAKEYADRVFSYFLKEYEAGRTPNPCCICNLLVKFGMLIEFAREIGASRVLTGHYAKLEHLPEGVVLRRGDDLRKDQSYFLYRLGQRELSFLSFPVGTLEKEEVRRIASRFGLVTSQKPDSQDACFQVEGECFGETLRRLCGFAAKPGRFVYRGRTVGRHAGVHQFTIGQRKGLNVALGVPAYIAAIDPVSGDIRLETDPESLLAHEFPVHDLVWQLGTPPEGERMDVQIRYRSRAVACRIESTGEERCRVIPDQPLRAVTPGQAAVFYRGDRLLGGGVIGSCC